MNRLGPQEKAPSNTASTLRSEVKADHHQRRGVFENFWFGFLTYENRQLKEYSKKEFLAFKYSLIKTSLQFIFFILFFVFVSVQIFFPPKWLAYDIFLELIFTFFLMTLTFMVQYFWLYGYQKASKHFRSRNHISDTPSGDTCKTNLDDSSFNFIRVGKLFKLRYENEEHTLSHLAGLKIIEALLKEPNKEFPPIHLARLNTKKERDLQIVANSTGENENSDGYGIGNVRDQTTIDGIARLNIDIAKLDLKMNAAFENDNDDLAQKYDLKIAQIQKEINKLQDIRGNDREMKTPIEKAASLVYNNILNAKRELTDPMPKFHQHITDHIIRNGNHFKYFVDADSLPVWRFE